MYYVYIKKKRIVDFIFNSYIRYIRHFTVFLRAFIQQFATWRNQEN